MDSARDIELLRAERDLYKRLVDLGAHEDLTALLEESLSLAVDITAAQQGYLALGAPDTPSDAPPFWIAHGCSAHELSAIRARLSQGIIAEALRTGRTVSTASAAEDPRFRAMRSVQAQRIQAVLCAPVGEKRGVIYLQGRASPGPFTERDKSLLEAFARSVSTLTDKLVQRASAPHADPTAAYRARLKADAIVGASRALADALKMLLVAAPVDAAVLITGESGTGKTELARCLHNSSPRARGPFVEINCAALPETLFEAELFGAEKGAHSTATRRLPGRIASAIGGTLLLDEIGEIPLTAQPKLLQFLQSRRFYRLGADAPTEADVRIVAATNVDLELAVREKRFREDLYYRLNVLSVRAPSLRERREDIPALADHLAASLTSARSPAVSLSPAARSALSHADWPGNVRQLSAIVQRGVAFARSEGSEVVERRHLFPELTDSVSSSAPATWSDANHRFQRALLQDTLDACDGNVSEAARRLDLARSHLHELLRTHGIQRARSAP